MRLIIFFLKCIVGLLASIGFLLVGGAAAIYFLAKQPERLEALKRPQVPERAVLSLDLSGGIIDTRPQSPFAQLSLGKVVVMRDAVEALEAAARDPKIKGLIARLGKGALGLAQVQELRAAIDKFGAQGKFTLAFAESFGEAGSGTLHYYLAGAFDEIWLQPSGQLDVSGFQFEIPFFREALDDWGIVPRIGQREEYKGAFSSLTDRDLPEPQRQNLQALADSWLGQIVRDIASDRGLEEAAVRTAINEAPAEADSAVDRNLIDGLGYWDQVHDEVVSRGEAELLDLMVYAGLHEPLAADGPNVALIYALGEVALTESEYDPAFGDSVMGVKTVTTAIAEAVEDPEIAAIVLRVDSPGGSYVAADAIWREVDLARQAGKPLIVSMGGVAASGGYFVAAPAHKIVALPGTITGSIGVVSGKFVLSGLWDRLGINWDGVQAGEAAGFWSMNQDFSTAEWARLERSLDRVYSDFTGKVAAGRDMTAEAVAEAAKGRIWSGEDAKDKGLVDELGGLETAFALAAEAAGAPGQRPKIKILPEPRDPFQALIDELMSGNLPSPGLSALVRDLARIAAVLRPLTDAMESLSQQPQLRVADPLPAH